MQTQVQKWGNSLGIRIPNNIAKKLSIKNGALVDLEILEHNLIIIPKTSELDLLLDNITDANCHHEALKDDETLGKETW